MPRILLPNGASREIPLLNPGDTLASGAPSGTVGQFLTPGVDAPVQAAPVFMRQTTAPKIDTPGVPRTRNTTRPGF